MRWLKWFRGGTPPKSVLDEPEVAETLAALDAAKVIQRDAETDLKEAGAIQAKTMTSTRAALAAVAARQNSRIQRR